MPSERLRGVGFFSYLGALTRERDKNTPLTKIENTSLSFSLSCLSLFLLSSPLFWNEKKKVRTEENSHDIFNHPDEFGHSPTFSFHWQQRESQNVPWRAIVFPSLSFLRVFSREPEEKKRDFWIIVKLLQMGVNWSDSVRSEAASLWRCQPRRLWPLQPTWTRQLSIPFSRRAHQINTTTSKRMITLRPWPRVKNHSTWNTSKTSGIFYFFADLQLSKNLFGQKQFPKRSEKI